MGPNDAMKSAAWIANPKVAGARAGRPTGPRNASPSPTQGDSDDSGPNRRCLVTRRVQPKSALVRFVIAPDGTLTPDLSEKLPGRGYWISAERTTLERAVAKGYFSRAAKANVRVPDGSVDGLVTALMVRCRNAVELARRAGQAVAGFEKVRSWAVSGRAAVLITASDAADNGRKKIEGLATGRPLVACLDSSALSTAFGREHVVHAALADGKLAERLVIEAGRLSGLMRPADGKPTQEKIAARRTGGSTTDENDG